MNNNSTGSTTLESESTKVYPPRGNLQQYRLAKTRTFTCNRCKKEKTSKLVATQDSEEDALMCNGCYGELLSGKSN